ncbi:amino acid ABC transporter permease [Komagataeibacter diospyri]|uniref:amino acid ABC transporter permease n=1 Tax=Komagataeibacter diospyri TaxID=1932662 RepID=UPI0037564183
MSAEIQLDDHSTIIERGRYHMVVSLVVVLAFVAWLIHAFAVSDIEWKYVSHFLMVRTIMQGVAATLLMAISAMMLGIVIGLTFAIVQQSGNPVWKTVAAGYVWLFRGTPVILQLLLWFNLALVFPHIWIPGYGSVQTVQLMTPFLSALLGLGLNQGAYITEIMRSGLTSVDRGQYEACCMIGMTRLLALRRVILPQALRVVIPPLGNEFISMIKLTSLSSMIQYPEILHSAQNIYYANARVIELLLVTGFWYLTIVTVLMPVQYFLEKRINRGWSG